MKDWLIAFAQAAGLCALVLVAVTAMVHLAHGQQRECRISEFYSIAWAFHNPTERHQQMMEWLGSRGPSCKFEELLNIWNNLGEWAGAADSAPLRAKVIELYERLPKK
jgi:hypothetical protein